MKYESCPLQETSSPGRAAPRSIETQPHVNPKFCSAQSTQSRHLHSHSHSLGQRREIVIRASASSQERRQSDSNTQLLTFGTLEVLACTAPSWRKSLPTRCTGSARPSSLCAPGRASRLGTGKKSSWRADRGVLAQSKMGDELQQVDSEIEALLKKRAAILEARVRPNYSRRRACILRARAKS